MTDLETFKNDNEKFVHILDNKTIDFKEVEDYFKDEKNKTNNKYNGFNDSDKVQSATAIDTAFAKALEYTNEIKKENMSLNEILNKFRKEIPRFEIVYNRTKQDFYNKNETYIKSMNNINFYKKYIKLTMSIDEDKMKQEALDFWEKINDFKNQFITTAAISAILAAGFWAASVVTAGISVPWAVAATIVAVTCSAAAEGTSVYMTTNDSIIEKITKGLEIAIEVATLVYNFFKELYAILQFSMISIGTTSVITVAGAAMFAVGISAFTWITKTDIFWAAENSKNKELQKWVEDAKNGIIRKYNFEFKEVGNKGWGSTHVQKTIGVRKWIDYASSIQEFKDVFKFVGFTDSLAQAGGQGTTVKKENFLIKTSDFIDRKKVEIIHYEYGFTFIEQKADVYLMAQIDNDDLMATFDIETDTYMAFYHVWAEVKFNDVYFTI